jgi:phosphatidylinositol alpha-1,6-mannosyltransferase
LDNVVRFTGFVDDAELPAYYNACDLFLMPNFEEQASGDIEGFGMVFLEANACAKPVIAGRSGGTAEAVLHGQTGILVNPHDPAELAEAVTSMICSPQLRARLGQTGLKRAHSEFNWAIRARMLNEVNREVLEMPMSPVDRRCNATSRN